MFPLSFTAFNILYWLSYSQVSCKTIYIYIVGQILFINQGEVTFNWDDHRLTVG